MVEYWTSNSKWVFVSDLLVSILAPRSPLRKVAKKFVRRLIEWRYGHLQEFHLDIEGVSVSYVTDDLYSKMWFYPRYKGGKIHEEPVTRLLMRDLKPGMCFFDIGACFGYYTVIASKAVGTRGVVHAFELDESNLSILKKNLARNECGNVKVHQVAVSEATGTVNYVRITDSPNPRHHLCSQLTTAELNTLVAVDSVSLDEFCTSAQIVPDVVKIDVEGAELKVLKGMERLLCKADIKVFCEVHPKELTGFDNTVDQVINKLYAFGMQIFRIVGMATREGDVVLQPIEFGANIVTGRTFFLYAHRAK